MLDYAKWVITNEANWYADDPILTRYAKRYLPPAVLSYVEQSFHRTGKLVPEAIDIRANYSDRDGAPKLIRYNRKGEEINEVWHNQDYLQTVKDGYGTGVVAYRYDKHAPVVIPFFVNSILIYLLCEAEIGFACPVGLTQSAAFVLEKFGSEEQQQTYLTRLASLNPEVFAEGATFLTEINGGSDVGAIETVAIKEGSHYLLTGEKWFASNCDAEIAIILARVNDKPSTRGLGLFVMPRTLPDGTKNRVTIRRLKDKLGARAVATGELVFNEAVGYLIGEEDNGFRYMAEALNVSRLDTALCGLAIARRAFFEASLYCQQRVTFGQQINKYPMVQETLIDMITEIEAGWAVSSQMIQLFDKVHTYNTATKADGNLLRMILSLAKYRLSELGVTVAKRSMELHGGNGYIEEYTTARLLRDAVVNPIWEGPANIQCLEVLKALQRNGPDTYLTDLQQTLTSVHREELRILKEQLQNKLSQLTAGFAHVLQQSEVRQAALAKKLADCMYELYAGIHLLEEANYDLVSTGNGRLALVVQHWIELMIEPAPDHGIMTASVITPTIFASLVAFQDISIEHVMVKA